MWSWNERKFIVTVSNYFSGKNNFRGPLPWFSFFFFLQKIEFNDSTPNYGQDVFLVPKINTNNRITLFSQNNASSFLRIQFGDCCFALDSEEFPRNGWRSYGSISCESSPGISWNLKGFGIDLGTKGIPFLQNGFIACIVNLFLESSAHLVSFHRISDFSQEPPVG